MSMYPWFFFMFIPQNNWKFRKRTQFLLAKSETKFFWKKMIWLFSYMCTVHKLFGYDLYWIMVLVGASRSENMLVLAGKKGILIYWNFYSFWWGDTYMVCEWPPLKTSRYIPVTSRILNLCKCRPDADPFISNVVTCLGLNH